MRACHLFFPRLTLIFFFFVFLLHLYFTIYIYINLVEEAKRELLLRRVQMYSQTLTHTHVYTTKSPFRNIPPRFFFYSTIHTNTHSHVGYITLNRLTNVYWWTKLPTRHPILQRSLDLSAGDLTRQKDFANWTIRNIPPFNLSTSPVGMKTTSHRVYRT